MRRMLIAIMVAAVAAPFGGARADTEVWEGTYLVPGPPTGGFVDQRAGYGIGGFFFASGGIPRAIKIEDVTGNPIGWKVCQDWNDNGICNNSEEYQGCARGKVDIPAGMGYRDDVPTSVFIRSMDEECESRGISRTEAIATTGTIFLTVQT